MNTGLQIVLILLFFLFFFKLFVWSGRQASRFYRALNQLQNTFFEIYLARNYEENIFHYEKLIHQYNLQALSVLKKNRTNAWERIFEVMQSVGQLRYRLLEQGTLEMLETELKIVNEALAKCLLSQGRQVQDFYESIQKLEISYHGAVQASSTHPWAMVFFIQDLFHLHKELKHE